MYMLYDLLFVGKERRRGWSHVIFFAGCELMAETYFLLGIFVIIKVGML